MSDILLFLAIVLNAVLALLIFSRNRQSPENIFYALFVLFTDFWMLSNFLENEPGLVGLDRLDLFLRLDFVFAALGMYFWLKFCAVISARAGYQPQWHRWFGWAGAVIVSLLIPLIYFTQLIIRDVRFYDSVIHFETGPLWIVYALFILAGLLIGPLILFIARRFAHNAKNEPLEQGVNMILVGFVIALGNAVVINLLQPILSISLEVSHIGIYGLSVLVVFTAYAIVKYSLFNLKVIATEALTGILWVILISKVIVSETAGSRIVDLFIFALSVVFGALLVRSVRREVRQREEMEILNKKLERANKKLEELSRFKTQLLSLASHQIKSPLATIKGFTSLISDGFYGQVNDKVKDVLGKVKGATNGLIDLINTLLDFRKAEEGKIEYSLTKTDIVPLISEAIAILQPAADAKKISLTFSSPGGSVFLEADGQKLKQVFQNLLDNAVKYTAKGSVKAELVKSVDSIIFSVTDSGIGISKELIPLLFGEFVRDDRVKTKILGTGLGLYICRKIVEAHGGKIWAESEGEGKGSKFSVAFPSAR